MRRVAMLSTVLMVLVVPIRADATPAERYDFNGDGFPDLAIGVPGENSLGANYGSGAVNVLYAGRYRLSIDDDQLWSQASPGITGAAEAPTNPDLLGDGFGAALASGDFDGDGFADLAVGAPGEDIASSRNAGAVNVIYGTGAGLDAARDQWLAQGPEDGLGSDLESFDHFGGALVAGDFNGDGRDDLAIGVPRESIGTHKAAGLVHVVYGSPRGLTRTSADTWHQGVSGIPDNPEGIAAGDGCYDRGDGFGSALGVGDFNGDGVEDLVIAVPNEVTDDGHGAVHVLFGSASGVTVLRNEFWTVPMRFRSPPSNGPTGFSMSLAAGEFDSNGFDDLVVGVPYEQVNGVLHAGAIHVLYGAASGVVGGREERWTQSSRGVPDSPRAGDTFGAALAVGDLRGDGSDDVAVGAPGDGPSSTRSGGTVTVLRGDGSGLTAADAVRLNQGSTGYASGSEVGDSFGRALMMEDHNNDGQDDLAVGVPGESHSGAQAAGLVHLHYGEYRGHESALGQATFGIAGRSESFDRFGATLGTGIAHTHDDEEEVC